MLDRFVMRPPARAVTLVRARRRRLTRGRNDFPLGQASCQASQRCFRYASGLCRNNTERRERRHESRARHYGKKTGRVKGSGAGRNRAPSATLCVYGVAGGFGERALQSWEWTIKEFVGVALEEALKLASALARPVR